MALTAATLAFDIVNRAKSQDDGIKRVNPQYPLSGDQFNACKAFLGRNLTAEVFITAAQAELFAKLSNQQHYSTVVVATGEGENRFAAYVKSIYSQAKGREYFKLIFGGYVPEKQTEPVSAPVASPVNPEQANICAASLIRNAVQNGRVIKDSQAAPGDDYDATWLSATQANDLTAKLTNVQPDGSFLTIAAGPFCFWGRKRTQNGAMLLCWLGSPETPKAPAAPAPVIAEGCRIPQDADIPF